MFFGTPFVNCKGNKTKEHEKFSITFRWGCRFGFAN